jgi:FKBP-type peptidyl-prolyl cis-trans isomerase
MLVGPYRRAFLGMLMLELVQECVVVVAWIPTQQRPLSASGVPSRRQTEQRHSLFAPLDLKLTGNDKDDNSVNESHFRNGRRESIATFVSIAAASACCGTAYNLPVAHALVKGVSPPPPKSASLEQLRPKKCTNVEECQAAAELREQQEREQQQANQVPALVTAKGTRYRDVQLKGSVVANNNNNNKNDRIVTVGDDVTVYYKVLKLGKRSYDGLSGEGTVVFSRGYGFEDDESAPRQKSWTTTVGATNNIAAFNDAVLGMSVGGIRRLVVLPDMGWRKPGRQCDGGPGGLGAGGDLKTDYVVVPTATMVATEACLDASKQPYPNTYAQQRRMAQRFDQSLILEVEVVNIANNGGSSFL